MKLSIAPKILFDKATVKFSEPHRIGLVTNGSVLPIATTAKIPNPSLYLLNFYF
jgi:hypothetical protein